MRELNRTRRRILQAGAAVGSFLALPRLSPAQSQSLLNALPRHALVIGNSKYPETPLRNPSNDAKAISDELRQLGFKVDVRIDAVRAQMADAIQAFSSELAKSKCVGLFYYAGHGAQLAWRNYLIPVDAAIENLEDMRDKAIELNSLLQGLVKARNPMNVIILDACRDNPFGTKVPTEHKGLSQFDAPPGSLLAYATSPGNTAADGEGANGLYTENLLREIKVPEAKIEDVFKRVRLKVRLKSEGQQIPWESTSLEEDFYFQPPRQTGKLSESELEQQFAEELSVWEKTKGSKALAALEEYLRRFPSGKFSELAQFRLDRLLAQRERAAKTAVETSPSAQSAAATEPELKRQEERARAETERKRTDLATPVPIAPNYAAQIAMNPFSKGTARLDTNYRIGDGYRYRVADILTKIESRQVGHTITAVTDTEVIFNNGNHITDLLGNLVKNSRGQTFTNAQVFVAEYSLGKKWETTYRGTLPNLEPDTWTNTFKVVARESITVPAGTFDAFKVEGRGFITGVGIRTEITYWVAPEKARVFIAYEQMNRNRFGKLMVTDRSELVSFNEAR